MKVKAQWMMKDYSWRKSERTVEERQQAKELADEISRRLNQMLNMGTILDYRVEY